MCIQAVRHVIWARVTAGGSRVLAAVRAARSERCATLAAPRALPVARQRPAWATLQDLYDSSEYTLSLPTYVHCCMEPAVRAARSERCATLAAPRALPVARQRPAWATLQDLYDSSEYTLSLPTYVHCCMEPAVRAARSERCATLAAPRALPVARQRPAWATLQDLYDSSEYTLSLPTYVHCCMEPAVRAARSERCATLAAPRALPVARQRPAWATLQDLYDSSEYTLSLPTYVHCCMEPAVRAARSERCATLAAPRALPVARQRPAWATLQDLYDSSEYTLSLPTYVHCCMEPAVRAARSERCATLAAPRALPVARQRPAWATLQDLYDSSEYTLSLPTYVHCCMAVSASVAGKPAPISYVMLPREQLQHLLCNNTGTYVSGHRARVFFAPISASACDVCRVWESCARACGAAALQVSDSNAEVTPDAAHQHLLAPVVMLLATTILLL